MSGVKGRSGGKRRRHIPAMFSPAQVAEIRAKRNAGLSYKLLGREFGRSRKTLSEVVNRRHAYK